MRTFAYLALLVLALWLNRRDKRMLALTLAIGASLFVIAPTEWPDFYIFCGLSELTIALVALRLKAAASAPIILLATLMAFTQYLGYKLDGSLPFSQYGAALDLLETSEILCCILLSSPIKPFITNRG